MPHPLVIGLPPHRDNIFYSVQPYMNIFQLSDTLMEHIRSNCPDVPKIVIFCPTLDASSQLNKLLHFKLRKNQIGPHIVDMFNRACSITKRTVIVKSFCERDGAVCIVIASTSFGMGVDCPNIRIIIHWGPPENLDTYMQETTGKLAMKNGASKYCFYIETVTVLVRLGTSRSRSPLVFFYIFDHNSKSLHHTPLI